MKSKEIYQSIDQAKVKKLKGGDKIIANIKRVEKETKGFTVENPKFDVAMTKLYGLLKTKNPEVLKDVKVEEKVTEVKVPTTKAERKKRPAKKTKTVKKTVKKATGKKKNTKPTPTPSAPKTKKVPFSTRAKQLADKEGISFAEARKKLSKQIKDEEAKIEKKVKSDLDKLLAFVRSDKFEDGEKYPKTYGQQSAETSSLSSDAKRKAKPRGKRISKKGAVNQHGVSEGGNVYYEYRDNRSDRNSIKAPQGQYKYKGKTPPYLEAGGTLPTPFGQAGLVGETGAMNEMELFAMGGGLPQGVHQYYANTYNPAYPIPHGYAKGGSIPQSSKDEFYQLRADDMDFADQYGEDDLQEWYEEQGRFAKGGYVDIIKVTEPRSGKRTEKQVSRKDTYREALKEVDRLNAKNKNPDVKFVTGNIFAKGGLITNEDIEDMVMDLSPNEYENFAIRFRIDPEDANEMSSFIYGLDDEKLKFVHKTLKTKDYAKGGQIDSVYVDELRFRTGMSKNAIEEIIERNNFSKDNLLNLMVGIDRGFIKPSLVSSAYFGGKTSKENKKLVEFSKSNKAFKMAKGGTVKGHLDKADGHLREVGTKLYKNKNPKEAKFRKAYNQFDERVDDLFTRRELSELGYAKGGEIDDKLFDKIYKKYRAKNYFGLDDRIKNKTEELKSFQRKGDKNALKYNEDDVKNYLEEQNYKRTYVYTYKPLINAIKNNDKDFLKNRVRYNEKFTKEIFETYTDNKLPNTNVAIAKYFDKNYAKGGELSKEFKFDKNFVIYVPSTSNVGDTISKAELDKRVNEVERFVANKFGGYTETETDGGYKSTSGKIIEEDIVKVSVFAKANDWKKNEKSVISKVRRWAKKWGQEAIGFEYEGDLYYVSDSKIMKNGGVIDAFNLQFIKDVPKTNLKVEKVNNKISYKKGGKIGFDALSKKVAKRYEGKAVPKKYQREYGKRYSKVEAQEVGDKVASKVYRQQLKNK